MSTKWQLAIISTLLCTLTISAQRAKHRHAVNNSVNDSAWSELESSMKRMHASMTSIEATDNIDADFAKLMIPHHQAAIDMAKTQLLYGTDPQMRRLAQEIITDQQSEIDLMKLWLKQHGLDPSEVPLRKPATRKE